MDKEEENDYVEFSKPKKPRRSTLKELFEQKSMTEQSSHDEDGMDIPNLMDNTSENPRLRRLHIEDSRGDFVSSDTISNWNYHRDLVTAQHRTTSIHRNIDRRQHVAIRTIPRNLEERRKWVTQAATLNRQPLLEHAQKIVEYMQQDSTLMTPGPDGEILRREALRNMPQSLAVKKLIKRKLMGSVNGTSKTLGCAKMLKYQISIRLSCLKSNIRNLSYSFELWYSSLKEIEGNFGSGVSTYFKFLRRLFVLDVFMAFLCVCFIIIPQAIFSVQKKEENVTVIGNDPFLIEDLFTGVGFLNNTVMYYGYFTIECINGYKIPNAYFYTMICIFVGNAIIIGVYMAKSYRKSFIETMGGLQNVFAHKIFCGWDYSIAQEEASNLRSSTIYTELKELLSDYIKSSEKRSFAETLLVYGMQLTGHLFVFGLVGATGFLMWTLLEQHRMRDVDESNANVVAVFTAVIINVIILLFPLIFRIIGSYEGYKSPRLMVIVTFLRTLLLETVVVGILIVFWLTHSGEQKCWENSLGQEIYRLILFDFFFSVVFISLFEVARYLLHKKFKIIGAPEFDISGNTFSVIYNQTLFWLGLVFAPMLGIVIVLKLFLTWHVRSWILLRFCVPPKKSWRAAQTETLFLIITFLSSLLLLFIHGYIMIQIRTSENCGPFRDVEFMHSIFLNAVEKLDTGNTFLMILRFISRPGVIALVFIGLSMLVYYLRSKSVAQRDFVTFLRRRLVLASQDKEFLLRHISEVANGDWHQKINQERETGFDPSKLPPSRPKQVRLAEYGDIVPGTSSDDLLGTSSTATSIPFSDISVSEYVRSEANG
ncbi:hypothetical protein Trydic_g14042 [Trypoxylus dichotomus]